MDQGSVRWGTFPRRIYGHGACDMKKGLPASIIAAEAFISTHAVILTEMQIV